MSGTGEAVEEGMPAGRPGGLWWWPRRRSVVLDVALALISAAECGGEGVLFARDARLPVAFGVVLGVLVGASLVLRRRWPIAVVLVSVAVTAAEMGLLLTVVGLYTLAASDIPRRITAVLAGMSFVAALIVTMVTLNRDMEGDWNQQWMWVAPLVAVMAIGVTAPPILLGLYVGARRRLVESLRERADGLERELSLLAERAEERAEWARNEERTRIAREMHDVVAHRVSLMVVHAAALQAVALKDPEKAAKNAGLVGDMGRQALTELRTMLGVLRSEDSVSGAAVTRPAGPAPLASVAAAASAAADEAAGGPSLAELEALVGQSRTAGMTVELSVEGEERRYAPRVEQTAYRVVQEALTNVHKHAPGATARVRLARRDAEVAVLVENGPSDRCAADADLPSGGNGLIGMRERVATLGGGFVSGPTDTGGFRVSAVIPNREPTA
ncbi:sensor histidine kinase [Streptomyces sp. XD-27]|uniref:sensor histidine kinase n=1 Tax=Streptomyces sp. XD-27 TaxID=3062779 RepID=UPI0026F4752D|nr:histidine kinase [Streptomyces sp. XD-27]WKX72252.1 histidine kinase [Streptomyces sp. XD-27]